MTREELARKTALRTGLTMKEVQIVLVTLLEVISETICRGDTVFLRGFGCFSTRMGRKRRVRDPRDDGVMEIPPRHRAVFRPYPALRDAVQNSLAPKSRVAFFCIGNPGATRVSVVGDFNNWKDGDAPMQRLPDGSWFAELSMPSGGTIYYCFSVDGEKKPDPGCRLTSNGMSVRQV
jgi:integration host factor subunit alpha